LSPLKALQEARGAGVRRMDAAWDYARLVTRGSLPVSPYNKSSATPQYGQSVRHEYVSGYVNTSGASRYEIPLPSVPPKWGAATSLSHPCDNSLHEARLEIAGLQAAYLASRPVYSMPY
jgi:hypothetical protein